MSFCFNRYINQLFDEDPDGFNGIVVAGDGEIDRVGIGVGVDYTDNRNIKLRSFGNGDLFFLGIYHNHQTRQIIHVFDTAEDLVQLFRFIVVTGAFLFGELFKSPVFFHALDVF